MSPEILNSGISKLYTILQSHSITLGLPLAESDLTPPPGFRLRLIVFDAEMRQ